MTAAPPRPPEGVLLVASVVPVWPVESGFQLRAAALLRELATLWEVVLAAPSTGPLPPELAGMRHHEPLPVTSRWAHLPANHDLLHLAAPMRALAARWNPSAALLLCGAEYLAAALPASLPMVADHVDCLSIAALETMLARRGLHARLTAVREAWQMARFERALVRRMHTTVVAGALDARALGRLGGSGALRYLPNGVDAAPAARWAACDPDPTAVFSGILDYGPNADAARFLAREVWPRVRRTMPAARLSLVGRRPPADVRALAKMPGVSVHADVHDMRAELQRAWLAVAPMRRGCGTKNKVLEAWGAGRAVVMTSRAVNGLALPPGHEALVVDGARAIAAAVGTLMRSPEWLEQLGATALAFAREHCSWRSLALGVHETLLAARRP